MNEIELFSRIVATNQDEKAVEKLLTWPTHSIAFALRAYPDLWPRRVLAWMIRQGAIDKEVAFMVTRLLKDWSDLDNFSLHLLDVNVSLAMALDLAQRNSCEPTLWNMVGLGYVYLNTETIHCVLAQNS